MKTPDKKKYLVKLPIFAYGEQWRKGSVVSITEEYAKEVGLDRLELVDAPAAAPEAKTPAVSAAAPESAPVADPAAGTDTQPPAEPAAGTDTTPEEDLSNL